VVDQTREWYCEWHCSQFKRHIAEYYSMLDKKMYYINGSRLNQLEPLEPDVTSDSMPFGFGIDGTTHPHKIRRRLQKLRTMEV
jgi:hypothetical protein